MDAHVGDHVIIEGPTIGQPARRGEIIEVLPGSQRDHYRVRWDRDQHESIFFPSSDTHVEHILS